MIWKSMPLVSCPLLKPAENIIHQLKFILAGTRQVYGRSRYLPVDENHLIDPVDYNGVAKCTGKCLIVCPACLRIAYGQSANDEYL